ncbi:TolC family protein [Microbulbifer bruguierae]|uniref:TolC family protein n=1 Tax=Microbulbifer bruguierae TaxID=3029061 RepID=A0ABY8NI18_9GAMM|nr:TolC family protein [Microbulbifer bruguierae]WGL18463.1 TolC family protein [Microbulbifer bruguierae]
MCILTTPSVRCLYFSMGLLATAALVLLLSPSVSAAALVPPSPLSLQQAIRRTLQRNPSLAVFDFRDRALSGRAQTAALRPAINLDAELENFAGSDGGENAEFTVALSSVIELDGKRDARVAAVNSERLLLDMERQIRALDLLGEITRRFVRVLAGSEREALASDAVRLALDTLNAVNARVSAGGAPQAEKWRAQASLARARLALNGAQQALRADRIALAAMWGDLSAEFSVAGSALYDVGVAGDFATFFQWLEESPRLARFASEERVAAAQLRLARTSASADIGWSLGVRQSRETDSTSLVAGVIVPLFSGNRARGEIASAQAVLGGISPEREAARLNFYTQLNRAFSLRAQAIDSVRQLRAEIIPAQMRALEETERYYRAGRYGYQEWVSAREELLDARRALIDEATRALLAAAEIEQLTAASVSAQPVSPATEK